MHFPPLGAELTVLFHVTQGSRLKALSRVITTVIGLQSPVDDCPRVLTPVLPIKLEPISFMRWQGFDPTPASWDFLSVSAAALMARVGWNPFPTQVLWSVGAPELRVTPRWRQALPLGLFLQRRSSITPFPLRMSYFYRDSPGGLWYDPDSSSSTATWPRPPGSLMAPLTWWVEGDGHVLGARCRRTSDCCVSPCLSARWSHLGVLQGTSNPVWRGPASRSTVGCKLGHDSPWDTITETSVKGSDAIINPQGWEKGSLSETPLLWLPFFGRYSNKPGYSSEIKAHAGVRGAYAGRTQAYGERTQ